jgi:hypothetical protein
LTPGPPPPQRRGPARTAARRARARPATCHCAGDPSPPPFLSPHIGCAAPLTAGPAARARVAARRPRRPPEHATVFPSPHCPSRPKGPFPGAGDRPSCHLRPTRRAAINPLPSRPFHHRPAKPAPRLHDGSNPRPNPCSS